MGPREHVTLRRQLCNARLALCRLALVVAGIGTALVVCDDARAVVEFATPARAAYCGTSQGEPPISLICWTPADGFTVSMYRGGRASKEYHRPNKGYQDLVGRILRFDQRWRST
jgi:hypothetical protein